MALPVTREDTSPAASRRPPRRWSAAWPLLAEPAFRRVWVVGICSGVVRWLEMLAIGVYVFEVTGSPLLVAVFTLLRMLPMTLFGAVTGVLTDRIGHRATLIASLAVLTLLSAVLAAAALTDRLALWHLAVGAVFGGLYWTTDLPARRNLLGALAGSSRLASAMSLDAASNNLTRALGPAAGGLLLALIGIGGALALSAVLYGVALMLMLVTRSPHGGRSGAAAAGLLRELWAGVRYATTDRAVQGALVVTVIFNVWAWPYTAMIPVLGADHLGLDAFGTGLLMSAKGVGALLGALAAGLAGGLAQYRRFCVGGTALCLVSVLVLASSDHAVIAGLAVLAAGFGAGAFSAMQATLIYLLSPPELRSRLLGVLSVCIGTAPLGYAHLGLLADWLGTIQALWVTGIEGLIALALAWLIWPQIR